jgi:micrococcal nuclease
MFLLIRHQIKFLALSLLLISLVATGCASGTNATYREANAGNLNRDENQPALLTQNTVPPAPDVTVNHAYKVVRVVDGDTVVILIDGKQTRVRLIGVDTPETVHPQKAVEAYGKEASQFTRILLEGKSVYLEYEAGASKLDKYGRTLAYVYRVPDRLFINQELIRQGYAHAYTRYPFRHLEAFRAHERAAREAKKGLWAEGATIVSDAQPATAPAKTSSPSQRQATVNTETVQRPTPQPRAQTQETTVYVTRTGAKYHRDGCRYLSRSRIPMSLSDAKQSYSACSICRPPQ